MVKAREDITLYGGRAENFRELRDELEEEWGFRPSKSEVVSYLMRDE